MLRTSVPPQREREGRREKEKKCEKIRGALSCFLARSLASIGISPTTFRRRGCAPRFGEDLVINHDAAISQSNVRSLAEGGGGWEDGGGTVRARDEGAAEDKKRDEREREREREREGGHLLITSAPINTASNKEGAPRRQWENGFEIAGRHENARDLIAELKKRVYIRTLAAESVETSKREIIRSRDREKAA